MVKIDLPDVGKKLDNLIKETKKSDVKNQENFNNFEIEMKDIGSKVDKNYNQLSDDHSLMESEIANLQVNFKDCNQSIETLTNRLQSNYEDLTRFVNKGLKTGSMNNVNSNSSNNQEVEEEMYRIKNDIKTLQTSLKDMKRLINQSGPGVTMTSSKTPSNDQMQSGNIGS